MKRPPRRAPDEPEDPANFTPQERAEIVRVAERLGRGRWWAEHYLKMRRSCPCDNADIPGPRCDPHCLLPVPIDVPYSPLPKDESRRRLILE